MVVVVVVVAVMVGVVVVGVAVVGVAVVAVVVVVGREEQAGWEEGILTPTLTPNP